MANNNLSLLGSLNRVEVPIIKVQIGEYQFGVYSRVDKEGKVITSSNGAQIQYPNYIQSLNVKKINGRVNQYTLNLSYPITENDDPNFFDKVFSSVSRTRKIIFSYGDASVPNYIYRNEEAIITKVTQKMNVGTAVISYTVNAVSSAQLAQIGSFSFKARDNVKPSTVIKELLFNEYYGLLDIFTGMRDKNLIETNNLIPTDDKEVHLDFMTNVSALDYLSYLVDCMKPYSATTNSNQQGSVYVLTIIDHTTEDYSVNLNNTKNNYVFNGPFFKIIRNDRFSDASNVYSIDIGFPSQNIVTSFEIDNNEAYSLMYDYQNRVNSSEYVQRLDDNGNYEKIYAPVVSSKNDHYLTREVDKTWWTKMTQYPIKATITIKGLLRPAILMSYVRLNVYYWGKKHSSSGLYVITSQNDEVGMSGYRTTLTLTRVGGDDFKNTVFQ